MKLRPVKFIAKRDDLKLETYKYTSEEYDSAELDLPTDEVMLSILHELLSSEEKEMKSDVDDTW